MIPSPDSPGSEAVLAGDRSFVTPNLEGTKFSSMSAAMKKRLRISQLISVA